MSRVCIQNTFLTVEEEKPVYTHRRARSCDIFGSSFVAVSSADLCPFDKDHIDAVAKDLLKVSLFHRRQQLAKLKEAMMNLDEEDALDACSTEASSISSASSECGSSAPSGSLEALDSESSPTVMSLESLTWQQISPVAEEHANGTCKPCLYFHYKEDGCRQGDECPFCHLCTRAEVDAKRKNKKMEQRALRRERYGR